MSCEGTSTENEIVQSSDGGKENGELNASLHFLAAFDGSSEGDLAVEASKEEKELSAENGGSAELGATENGAGLSKSALKRLKSRERSVVWL